jgi:uncharacterized damage-inducible protein DinB
MEVTKFFLDQLEREVSATRKVLAQVPEGRNSWKPHERSMELGYLATLVAQMPAWIAMVIATEQMNLDDKKSSGQFQTKPLDSREALLKLAGDSSTKAQAALRGTTEDHLNGKWSLLMHGKILRSGRKYQEIADVFTHLAHHRGQLTVYLRLNDAKVPAIYGPSADEKAG